MRTLVSIIISSSMTVDIAVVICGIITTAAMTRTKKTTTTFATLAAIAVVITAIAISQGADMTQMTTAMSQPVPVVDATTD